MITRDRLLDEIIAFYEDVLRPATTLRLSEHGMSVVRRWPRDKGDAGGVLPDKVCGLRVVIDHTIGADYLLE
jgi:hypothetical protein